MGSDTSTQPALSSVEHDGFTVTSTDTSPEDITKSLTPQAEPEEADLSKAASELGKKGGKAAAEKKAKEAKEAAKETKEEVKEPEEAPEPEEAKDPEKAEEERKSKARQRVEEATREAAQLKREIAAERAERERLAREVRELRESRERPQERRGALQESPEPPKPKLEDFETHEEWVEAMVEFKADQKLFEYQRQSYQRAAVAAQHQALAGDVQTFNGRLAKAREADPEFDTRIHPDISGLEPSFTLPRDQNGRRQIEGKNVLADEVVRSEHGPEIMLYLSEHHDEYQRIAALRAPRDIVREVAIIEHSIKDATAGNSSETVQPAPKPAPSKASAPVRPVTGSPYVASGDKGPKPGESFDDWYRRTNPKR